MQNGYNGNLLSRDALKVGGRIGVMIKEMIQLSRQTLKKGNH
ncbi:small, acid-soluble spore protein, alpha/beta type [Pontibacillus halophilus]|nr:small, acid-soluble spore protein, alpha/beta type [Pontibacillus halophilus]